MGHIDHITNIIGILLLPFFLDKSIKYLPGTHSSMQINPVPIADFLKIGHIVSPGFVFDRIGHKFPSQDKPFGYQRIDKQMGGLHSSVSRIIEFQKTGKPLIQVHHSFTECPPTTCSLMRYSINYLHIYAID